MTPINVKETLRGAKNVFIKLLVFYTLKIRPHKNLSIKFYHDVHLPISTKWHPAILGIRIGINVNVQQAKLECNIHSIIYSCGQAYKINIRSCYKIKQIHVVSALSILSFLIVVVCMQSVFLALLLSVSHYDRI
jgi:hypothetical protein